MAQISNILDMIAQGVRDSNPVYRERQKVLQQQLFQNQQRQTTTPYENFMMKQDTLAHQDLENQRQQAIKEHYEGAVAGGKAVFTDAHGNELSDDAQAGTSPAQKAVAGAPAATGPGDAATNGVGGAGGNGMQGALTPTGAVATSSPSGASTESGGGPSAPPIWNNPFESMISQGPLTGGVGGNAAGNTSANTQQSRASSAQAGPLAQISQGSVTPSETAAGQTGMNSGAQPSATGQSFPQRRPDAALSDGRYVRFLTPQEQDTRATTQARANAAANRKISLDAVNEYAADPANVDMIKNNPNLLAGMRMQAQTGQKPPVSSNSALAAQYADALEKGDTPRADSLAKALGAMHAARGAGAGENLGGFLNSGLDQPALDRLAILYNQTGTIPALGMGNPSLRRAIFQRASDIDPTNNLAASGASFKADQASLSKITPGYDAMVAFENTGQKNLKTFLDQAQTLKDQMADTGIPLVNTPLRDLQKVLGEKDIPAYQAARQVAINEIARVTNNPNLVGVMPEGARKEVENFVPNNATLGQLEEVAKVLTSDMDARKSSYEDQIKNIGMRMGRGKYELAHMGENGGTPAAAAAPTPTPPPTAKPTGGNAPGKKYAATDTDTRTGEPVGSDDGWKSIYEVRTGKKLQ